MKAVVFRRYGPPDVLALEDVPKPEPRPNEVLVRVRATSVNDWDWCFVRGKPYPFRLMFGLSRPKVSVLGAEVAGTIEATGRDATKFRPGDEAYGDISEAGFGGFAEYICVDERALVRKPESLTFEQAAALPHAAMLALQGLVDVGKIQRDERVLINGAGGGVGTIGVGIAKQFGAEVTGVDRADKLPKLRTLGFDHTIDYEREDFTRRGEHYDLILDTKTNRSPFSYLRALGPAGRYVSVGGSIPRLLQTFLVSGLISRMSGKHLRVVALRPNKDLDYVSGLFEGGAVEIVIDGPYSLSDVPYAVQRFGEARHIGKVVITVAV